MYLKIIARASLVYHKLDPGGWYETFDLLG